MESQLLTWMPDVPDEADTYYSHFYTDDERDSISKSITQPQRQQHFIASQRCVQLLIAQLERVCDEEEEKKVEVKAGKEEQVEKEDKKDEKKKRKNKKEGKKKQRREESEDRREETTEETEEGKDDDKEERRVEAVAAV
jgi:hypothetical protein